MPTAEQRSYYVRRAMDVRQMAQAAADPDIRTTLEAMARSYDQLVEEADRIATLRTGQRADDSAKAVSGWFAVAP